eukprot:2969156-Amphidinium_carterae.1
MPKVHRTFCVHTGLMLRNQPRCGYNLVPVAKCPIEFLDPAEVSEQIGITCRLSTTLDHSVVRGLAAGSSLSRSVIWHCSCKTPDVSHLARALHMPST